MSDGIPTGELLSQSTWMCSIDRTCQISPQSGISISTPASGIWASPHQTLCAHQIGEIWCLAIVSICTSTEGDWPFLCLNINL